MSNFITFSRGISEAKELKYLMGKPAYLVNFFRQPAKAKFRSGLIVLGWGKKRNTAKARAYSNKNKIPYWSLEDGFISYLGHPALGDRRFSLIVDKSGIYYDATQNSDIENLLNNPTG